MRSDSPSSSVVRALGRHTLVFRERYATRGRLLPLISFALLAAMLALWLFDYRHDLWEKLVVLAFLCAAGGIGSSAIALREPRLRREARRGLVLSVAAATAAMAMEPVLWWVIRSGRPGR